MNMFVDFNKCDDTH